MFHFTGFDGPWGGHDAARNGEGRAGGKFGVGKVLDSDDENVTYLLTNVKYATSIGFSVPFHGRLQLYKRQILGMAKAKVSSSYRPITD